MTKKLEQQRNELEDKKTAFEKEKAAFDFVSKDIEDFRRVNTLDVNMKELVLLLMFPCLSLRFVTCLTPLRWMSVLSLLSLLSNLRLTFGNLG